jgi:CxxC-x17-CxxC domain-containing protein
MSYADKTLNCRDCGTPFVFTAGEQEFYAQKGFTNEPTRCQPCRQQRKSQMNGRGSDNGGGYRERPMSGGSREQFTTTCAGCGKEATVPFVPRNNKPVYCDDCFQDQRRGSRSSLSLTIEHSRYSSIDQGRQPERKARFARVGIYKKSPLRVTS